MAKPERVAFLGLGIMGEPMAANLVKAGFELIVWNRTEAKARAFAGSYGAHPEPSPAAAAELADVTITMVPTARRWRTSCSATTARPKGCATARSRSTCR